MLIVGTEYPNRPPSGSLRDGSVFSLCRFGSFRDEGNVAAAFLNCLFEGVEWHWTLFNGCVFFGCIFDNCAFRSVNFFGCAFVECRFTGCRFLDDSLKGKCSAEGVRVYASTAIDCIGEEVLFRERGL